MQLEDALRTNQSLNKSTKICIAPPTEHGRMHLTIQNMIQNKMLTKVDIKHRETKVAKTI